MFGSILNLLYSYFLIIATLASLFPLFRPPPNPCGITGMMEQVLLFGGERAVGRAYFSFGGTPPPYFLEAS